MKRVLCLTAIAVFLFVSCEKNDIEYIESSNIEVNVENRAIRTVILGKKKNNPYSVQNMQAALDSLNAHPKELSGCMNAPSLVNEIEISVTDLYVRFLPLDSIQYKRLMTDTTLTLFDFPLDYEIVQTGEYYFDPTISGPYTWLYTKVDKDYLFPDGIIYEVLEELFIMENSPYYSEEFAEYNESDDSSPLMVKGNKDSDLTDVLKTIEAISHFNTGNKYGQSGSSSSTPEGMQKLKRSVKKTFLWHTWYEYEYYPSGTIKVKGYHTLNGNAIAARYSTLTDVPVKGVKVHFWDGFFKWNSAYTDVNGYYESTINYNNDLYYDLYFTGRNGGNAWDMDRVMLWGVCLWVQKLSLGSGRESNDGYSTTIETTSDGWDACITNNAFYEFMTICDKEGLTRPSAHLQVALREMNGSSSAPLFQNHTNTLTTSILGGFFASTFFIGGSGALYTVAYIAFLNSLPDILISGGNLNDYKSSGDATRKSKLNSFYSTVWHELTHASHFRRIQIEKGHGIASDYWSKLIGTEVGHSVASMLDANPSPYGIRGDNNWEQVALAEGWANYRGTWKLPLTYLYSQNKKSGFPRDYQDMYDKLNKSGCSNKNLEKCLTSRTFSEYKQLLISEYPSNLVLQDSINAIIDRYHNLK